MVDGEGPLPGSPRAGSRGSRPPPTCSQEAGFGVHRHSVHSSLMPSQAELGVILRICEGLGTLKGSQKVIQLGLPWPGVRFRSKKLPRTVLQRPQPAL